MAISNDESCPEMTVVRSQTTVTCLRYPMSSSLGLTAPFGAFVVATGTDSEEPGAGLWIGLHHRLERRAVQSLVAHLVAWLESGDLGGIREEIQIDKRLPDLERLVAEARALLTPEQWAAIKTVDQTQVRTPQ